MTIKIDRSFEKDTNNIKDKALIKKVISCIEDVKNASSIIQIKEIKKLKGYKGYYRIRIGDYRVGLEVENDVVIFERFLHRKEIYKFFP
jgi:mRNA interferase RelE/StbE